MKSLSLCNSLSLTILVLYILTHPCLSHPLSMGSVSSTVKTASLTTPIPTHYPSNLTHAISVPKTTTRTVHIASLDNKKSQSVVTARHAELRHRHHHAGRRTLSTSHSQEQYEPADQADGEEYEEYETEEEYQSSAPSSSSTSSSTFSSSSNSFYSASSGLSSSSVSSSSPSSEVMSSNVPENTPSATTTSTYFRAEGYDDASGNMSATSTTNEPSTRVMQEQESYDEQNQQVVTGGASSYSNDTRHAHTNMKHLTKMILKIITTYKIKSMIDIPCRNSLQFMPKLLHTIDFERPGFKYYCVDSERDGHEDFAHLFADAGSPEIMHVKPETASTMPKTDLVFMWDGPQDWGVTKFWTFLMHLRQIRPAYILVTNNPGETNGDKEGILNLRKQPFHFAQASRVINNVWDNDSPKKQLLFYKIASIRRGF